MTAGRKNVAVVEDTPDTAEMFRLFLNQLCDDFAVSSFHNGPEFLKTLQPGFYSAIILDISLPGMDGFEVLRRTRSIDAAVPVIALTAHAGHDYRQRAVEAGFNELRDQADTRPRRVLSKDHRSCRP